MAEITYINVCWKNDCLSVCFSARKLSPPTVRVTATSEIFCDLQSFSRYSGNVPEYN